MFSKAIAKLLLFINVISFLLFTAFILAAAIALWPQIERELRPLAPSPFQSYSGLFVYLLPIGLLVVNVIVHGFIALIGACLNELERSREVLEDIRDLWQRTGPYG
jgi:hypothetical protein